MNNTHISFSESARSFTDTDPKNISEEIAKYRALKSQGMLNTQPTEHSTELSTGVSPASRFHRTDTSSLSIPLFSQSTPKAGETGAQWSGSPSQGELTKGSNSKGSGYADSIKEALAHYIANSQKRKPISPNATVLSQDSNEKMKTMTPPTPSDVQEADYPEQPKNKTRKSKQEKIALAPKTPVKRGSTHAVKSFTSPENRKSNLSTAEKTPRFSSPDVRREVEVNKTDYTVIKLSKEVKEWRAFGEKMAKSYGDLNKKFKEFIKEKEKAKVTILFLQKQVSSLQSISTKYEKENVRLRRMSVQTSMMTPAKSPKKGSQVPEKVVEELKQENQKMKKTVEILKSENKAKQASLEESQKEADYYKKLAQSKFKECSTLAEEIICLRTDLDRSHSNFLRIQRARTSNGEIGEEIKDLRLRKGGLKGVESNKENGVRKGVSWKDELEEESSKIKK